MGRTSGLTDTTFHDLGLDARILSAVTSTGYTHPTPIQEEAIPHVIQGGDVTGIAQTGTGKTAAFVLPMLHRLAQGRARARMPRSLILCPTRELAAQVAENFDAYGADLKLSMALLIGGVSFKDQEKKLMRGVDVLVATPGRLIDQFERGKILLTSVEVFVIDEADRMLDMGFIPDIEKICSLLPPRRQTLLFSATMPKEIARLAKTFQRDPKRIEVARQSQAADTITQYVVKLPRGDDKARRTALRRVIDTREIKNGIVFCNRKREVDIVAKSLTKHGYQAEPIHGDLAQSQRMETLQKFRDGDLKLLVASDVAARGLDIPDVSHVFNYSPPPKDEDYVHRIGRTGRAGRLGESVTLVGPEDEKSWRGVLGLIRTDVEAFMPDGLEAELNDLPEDTARRGRGRRGDGDSGRRGGRDRERHRRGAKGSSDDPRKQAASRGTPPPGVRPTKVEQRSDVKNSSVEKRPSRGSERRKDDDPILAPAPEHQSGFGDNIPDFLK